MLVTFNFFAYVVTIKTIKKADIVRKQSTSLKDADKRLFTMKATVKKKKRREK